ncbi:MAG: hypothetical protein J6X92_02025, partial [Bacteroidales bacterium]|nr:hypothetical protein [Bacteroidales bacterium]
ALVFAGVDATYEDFMNGHINYAINNYLTNENNISEHHSYVGESQRDSILKIINDGVSFVNYTGHGNPNTWLNVNISSRDTSLLINNNKYPIIISNACQTSKFNVGSLGNSMVLAKQKGAVAFIGSSHDTYWSEDFFWAVGTGTPGLNPTYDNTGRGAYDRLFHTHNEPPTEWYRSLGQILYSGNLSVSSSSINRKKRYWEIYNMVGDPSLIPYIGEPKTINISIPDTLPNNISSLSLRGEPFAYVAISHNDTILAASHFNQTGIATLTIPDMANDSCLVVVTGQNIRPIIKKIYIDESNSEYVSLSSYSFSEMEGDYDQLLEHGETISVNVNVKNIGNKATTNLRAYLRSSSEWVSIIDSTHYMGSLSAQDSILFSDCFSFKIADSIPDNYFVHFEIVLKDDYDEKHYGIEAKIHSPILNIINCRIDDSELGNDNNIIESGESFEIIYTVTNTGSELATVSLISTCDNPAIIIQNISPFSLNDSSTHIIRLRISQNTTLPLGTRIRITSTIRCSHISSNTITSSIQIGGAIESFESENFSSFPWMTDRENPWTISSSTAVEGIHSAQTGSISNDQSSSLSILCLYEQADTISFYYKVSTEYLYD